MHPPLKPAKSFSKRQPLQQIQQSHNKTLSKETEINAQVATKFRNSIENEENHDEHDLVKQTRNLRIGWNRYDGSNKGVLLANIVSGNYQNSQKNNENFNQSHQNSRNNYNNNNRNYSQENIAPNKVKYSRVATGNNLSNSTNNPRYLQSSQYYNVNQNENYRFSLNNRRNASNQGTDQIDKTDLRYTAKYWTASENDTKTNENIENTFKSVQEENPSSTIISVSSSSASSNIENNKQQIRSRPPLRASSNQKQSSHKTSKKTVTTNEFNQRYNKKNNSRTFSNYSNNYNQTTDNARPAAHETNQEQTANNHKNALQGIDLRNHASVVIVDYLPESAVTTRHSSDDSNGNHSDDDDNEVTEENDGFQQVMTKKKKKAEKLKAAAAAENLINKNRRTNNFLNNRNHRSSFTNEFRTKYGNNRERPSRGYDRNHHIVTHNKSNRIYESSSAYLSTSSGSTSPSSSTTKSTKSVEVVICPNNALKTNSIKHESQKYNQVVRAGENKQLVSKTIAVNKKSLNSCGKVILNAQQERDTISPSLDLNLKIASCKAVWENPNKTKESTDLQSSTEKTELTITETVLKDILEPLMKQTNEPLVNGYYEKDPIAQTDSMGSTVFSGFSKQANLLASVQKNSLNESHSSSLSQSSSNYFNNIEPFFEATSFNNKNQSEQNELKLSSPNLSNGSDLSNSNQLMAIYKNTEPTLEPCLNNVKTTDYNFQSCSQAYPLSSSANHLVRNIIIDNVPPSPSPSVSSYASIPSMSNNNSFHPTPASNMQPIQNNNLVQSHYNPFSNSLIQQDYIQNVHQEQMQPIYPYVPNQQHTISQVFPANTSQPPLFQPQSMALLQNQDFFQQTCNNPSKFELLNASGNMNPTICNQHSNQMMNNISYQTQQIHNAIPFNPFNSNPFNQPQMNTLSNSLNDSNNIQNLSKNGTSPLFQQQQQHKNFSEQMSNSTSNSNLYSLFSSSNNNIMPNPYNFGKNTSSQEFNNGFQQHQQRTMTPSNSTGSINYLMQFNQLQTQNSPEYFMNNNSLSRQASFNNLTKNTGLFDRLPSFDNGKMNNSYPNNQQINYENQNMCSTNPSVTMQTNTPNYFHPNSYMMNRNNTQSNHHMPLNEQANYQMNYSNDPNQYHYIQPNGYNQFNVQYHAKDGQNYLPNQPSLLNQPNYQSPLLPQPPQFSMQNRTTIANNTYNRFKKYPHYQNNININNNRQHANSKCFNNSTQRRVANNFNVNNQSSIIKKNDLASSKSFQVSQKNTSPLKPVQKFTILPKPKNTATLAQETKKTDELYKK